MNRKNEEVVVSILCAAYNHERFIRDALDSFLMQETTFPFEIIVNEDASTDGTANILREYEKQNPGIIHVIYQKENQYSKGIDVLKIMLEKSKGRYIATCEGDDYWTDKNKLQKQVDYMDSHNDCSLCGHANLIVDENRTLVRERKDCKDNSKVNLICDGGYMHFATRLAKREVYSQLPDILNKKYYQGVSYIYFAHLLGYLYYDGTAMSAWRINNDSVTHSLYLGPQRAIEIYEDYMGFYRNFDLYSNHSLHKSILVRQSEQILELVLKARKYLPKRIYKEMKLEESFSLLPAKIKIYILFKTLFSSNKTIRKKRGANG